MLLEGGCGSESTEANPNSFVYSEDCCGLMLPLKSTIWITWLDVTCFCSGKTPHRRTNRRLPSGEMPTATNTAQSTRRLASRTRS